MRGTVLTNVRCGGCRASISPVAAPGEHTVLYMCDCGHENRIPLYSSSLDPLDVALTEVQASLSGLSVRGRAGQVVEALRSARRLEVDADTRSRIAEIMGRRI